jgi:hypothetical protein
MNSWMRRGGAVRDVQRLLLVIGATALGAAAGGLGVFCCVEAMSSLQAVAGNHNLGAAGLGFLALLLFAGGVCLGAVVGFVAAVRRVRTRQSEPWRPRVWCGVALGVLIGLTPYSVGRLASSPPQVGVPESRPVAWARGVSDRLPGSATDFLELMARWPVAAGLLTAALGMLGGVVAKFAGSPWDRPDGDPPRK